MLRMKKNKVERQGGCEKKKRKKEIFILFYLFI